MPAPALSRAPATSLPALAVAYTCVGAAAALLGVFGTLVGYLIVTRPGFGGGRALAALGLGLPAVLALLLLFASLGRALGWGRWTLALAGGMGAALALLSPAFLWGPPPLLGYRWGGGLFWYAVAGGTLPGLLAVAAAWLLRR